jgi:signal transduction histidine kinase
MEHYQRDERIALGTGNDEIYEMAATFDQLLDEVQTLITREQQFTSDVSHELRTPISVILMQCESLLDQDLIPELQHSIQIIQQKARSMHQMISQLLMLSRADAGRTKLEMEELDFSELCEMSAQEQSFIAQAKNIEMKTNITPNIMFHGDMTLLIRLLVNLLSNAITYGKEGGWIELSLHQDEQSTILKVADNGIGIAKEHLPHIFNRFYQVDTSRTTSHSGLGLSMVKWICEVHQGTIQVDSIINEGTTFTLTFPK